jgi:2-polyprenyl-6-methoxyphenol hydroxylase-like FAD-dependent oxidoreductase
MSDEAPVLIAGGGLVGLSAATFLAHQGIRSVTIERLRASSPLPRAAFFHMRTLEMFRSVGIENRVREESALDFVPEGAIIAMDCLAGRKLADIVANLNEGVEAVSPCRRLFLNQPRLEPILRDRAREAGATILQGVQLTDVRQDSSGVSVTVEDADGGAARELRGQYLIAADGGHSRVRQCLGIDYEGRGAFSNSVTIYFTADLSPWLGDKAWSLIYVNNPLFRGFFRMNRSAQAGFLAINTLGDPQQDEQAAANAAADVSERRLIELVRTGVGDPQLAVRIDGYTRWRATANVAQEFQDRRIFIAGDAAHLMPPNGGFGGNTGIHDAHNLAWKLALVLQGHASAKLLDSYAPERKPVARFTVEQAFARYVARTAPWLQASQRPEPLVDDLNIELGYLYNCPLGGHADPRTTRGVPGSGTARVARARGPPPFYDRSDGSLPVAGRRARRRLDGGCQESERSLRRAAARCLLHRQGFRRHRRPLSALLRNLELRCIARAARWLRRLALRTRRARCGRRLARCPEPQPGRHPAH